MLLAGVLSLLASSSAAGGSSPWDDQSTAAAWDRGRASQGARYHDYDGMVGELRRLEAAYPDFIEVYDAQSRFGLTSPGACGAAREPCKQWVARLTNERTLRVAGGERPEVFLSGALHGNERVGPNAVLALITLLVENRAAADTIGAIAARNGTASAAKPRPEPADPWLARLVDTRVLVAVPMTNVLGYEQNVREENGIDPNRDFPYVVAAPSQCMQTTVARTVNELYRAHAFQLAITFHGGMRAIAYNWGGPNHYGTGNGRGPLDAAAPDDAAQEDVARAMAAFGGRFDDPHSGGAAPPLYPVGRLNDVVYAVRGGMEDWGYGGSWEPGVLPQGGCTGGLGAGYGAERTSAMAGYPSAAARAFTILVETSNNKAPVADRLAGPRGHVARNMRVALAAADCVQPYIFWSSPVVGAAASAASAAVAAKATPAKLAAATAAGAVGLEILWRWGAPPAGGGEGGGAAPATAEISLGWRVGGAFVVDETRLLWAPLTALPAAAKASSSQGDDGTAAVGTDFNRDQAAAAQLLAAAGVGGAARNGAGASAVQQGAAMWSDVAAEPDEYRSHPTGAAAAAESTSEGGWGMGGGAAPRTGTVFEASAVLQAPAPNAAADTRAVVISAATVDAHWGRWWGRATDGRKKAHRPAPDMAPQSHVANARTNPTWAEVAEGGGSVVKGRRRWFGAPLTVQLRVLQAPRCTAGCTAKTLCATAAANASVPATVTSGCFCACASIAVGNALSALREHFVWSAPSPAAVVVLEQQRFLCSYMCNSAGVAPSTGNSSGNSSGGGGGSFGNATDSMAHAAGHAGEIPVPTNGVGALPSSNRGPGAAKGHADFPGDSSSVWISVVGAAACLGAVAGCVVLVRHARRKRVRYLTVQQGTQMPAGSDFEGDHGSGGSRVVAQRARNTRKTKADLAASFDAAADFAKQGVSSVSDSSDAVNVQLHGGSPELQLAPRSCAPSVNV